VIQGCRSFTARNPKWQGEIHALPTIPACSLEAAMYANSFHFRLAIAEVERKVSNGISSRSSALGLKFVYLGGSKYFAHL